MKNFAKLLLILALGISPFRAWSQIDMFEEIPEQEPKITPYDSLSNMHTQRYGNRENFSLTFHHLIGQTLMYCGDPYSYYTSTKFKVGDYYKVTGVLPNDVSKGLYGRFTVVNVETGAELEEGGLSDNKNNFKWVVVGHFEKIKSLYLNKEFVYVGTKNTFIHYDWEKANHLISMAADTVTRKVDLESIWACVGVQVKPRKKGDGMDIDKRSPIVLVFDNAKYGKHYCYLEADTGYPYQLLVSQGELPLVCGRFQLKSYYDNIKAKNAAAYKQRKAELTQKYGSEMANLILAGRIRIGMTKDMCRAAWGAPDDINQTITSYSTSEQWVYGYQYVYFEGDKITAIQD